ncbi:MAG: type VI secretion system protein TssA [Phycisphaeraceae bacterium]|nr:type VI secretion system protein TssA [Phycisphaerales bacterium]QOJ18269.1 MAG: type VI secretion system protein TssA [Phycisphaeraceae bacterium]
MNLVGVCMAIDIDSLLQVISPDHPCGEDLSYDPAFLDLERSFQGKPAQQMGDAVVEGEEPDWREVSRMGQEALGRSHDLRIGVMLTVAWLQTNGYRGLADGLTLLRRMMADHWDHLHPQLDPEDNNDPLMRMNILGGISSPPGGFGDPVRLRMRVAAAPLCRSRQFGVVTLRDIQKAAMADSGASEGDSSGSAEAAGMSGTTIAAAFQDADLDELVATFEAVNAAAEALDGMIADLIDRIGGSSLPDLDGLKGDLRLARKELQQRLALRGHGAEAAGSAEGDAPAGDGGDGRSPAARLSGEIGSPQDVRLALGKISRYYEANEPSSPVPLFVEVALALVQKSYLEICEAIPPDTLESVKRVRSTLSGG